MAKTPPKAKADNQTVELIRALTLHISASEAKYWALVKFLTEKGTFRQQDYEDWQKKHAKDITDVQNVYYGRVVDTLQQKGVV